MKRQDSLGPYVVIGNCPDEEVAWCSAPSLLPQYDHWFNYPDCFHIYRCNNGLCYLSNLIRLLSFWMFSTINTRLVVNVNFWWVEGVDICFLGIFLGDCRGWNDEKFPCRNEDIINLGKCTLVVSRVYHPVHSCITIQILDIQVNIESLALIMKDWILCL